MFTQLEVYLLGLAHVLPIKVFVVVASFVEEVIAPIPSPTVMVLSGSIAQVQGYVLSGLLLLSVLGAVGKTIGALIIYGLSEKIGGAMITRFGKYFGIAYEDIQILGARLTGGFRDYLIMTGLRSLPVMPSSIVSVGSGLLKVRLRVYIVSTFIGTMIRDSFYLYVGYEGMDMLQALVNKSATLETVVEFLVLLGVIALIIFLRLRKSTQTKSDSDIGAPPTL